LGKTSAQWTQPTALQQASAATNSMMKNIFSIMNGLNHIVRKHDHKRHWKDPIEHFIAALPSSRPNSHRDRGEIQSKVRDQAVSEQRFGPNHGNFMPSVTLARLIPSKGHAPPILPCAGAFASVELAGSRVRRATRRAPDWTAAENSSIEILTDGRHGRHGICRPGRSLSRSLLFHELDTLAEVLMADLRLLPARPVIIVRQKLSPRISFRNTFHELSDGDILIGIGPSVEGAQSRNLTWQSALPCYV
jgi:hypothetical protein